jgi:putative ABC transport system substrate-binding protein
MRRREFLALLGAAGSCLLSPLPAQTQTRKPRRIGFLAGGVQPAVLALSPYGGFLQGMRDLGYQEGRDFAVDWRFAEGHYERFSEFAAEFVRLNVDVIVTAIGAAVPTLERATTTIPIVMGYSIDPVGSRFVASLARPGGNITGLSSALHDIFSKQVDLLALAVPNLSRVAVLINPQNIGSESNLTSLEEVAALAHKTVVQFEGRIGPEIDAAFAAMAKQDIQALIVPADASLFVQRRRIADLARRARLPSIFANREYAEAGGLMSYGDSLEEFYRRAAAYVDKIFKGAKAAELPIEQPTLFHLVLNRKTAAAIGLTIPPQLLVFADEVLD